jgi:hypothetical protein
VDDPLQCLHERLHPAVVSQAMSLGGFTIIDHEDFLFVCLPIYRMELYYCTPILILDYQARTLMHESVHLCLIIDRGVRLNAYDEQIGKYRGDSL